MCAYMYVYVHVCMCFMYMLCENSMFLTFMSSRLEVIAIQTQGNFEGQFCGNCPICVHTCMYMYMYVCVLCTCYVKILCS